MKAVVFPGQGSQFVGMGKEDYESSEKIKSLYDSANTILGFSLSDIMFYGSEDDLKRTDITQPAVFLYSVAKFLQAHVTPDAVGGHSLGEFSALVANGTLSFEDALKLVVIRSKAMQAACEEEKGTMAAILGLEDVQIEQICAGINDVVVPANYNCPGQLVISGSVSGIEAAVAQCTEAGARRALVLNVGGAFHSPLMQSAEEELGKAIQEVTFNAPKVPIYQNVDGKAHTDIDEIKSNLLRQLTSPVRWTQTMQNMVAAGLTSHVESGGKVLSGFIRKVDRSLESSQL